MRKAGGNKYIDQVREICISGNMRDPMSMNSCSLIYGSLSLEYDFKIFLQSFLNLMAYKNGDIKGLLQWILESNKRKFLNQ